MTGIETALVAAGVGASTAAAVSSAAGVLSIGSTLLSVVGGIQQGKAQEQSVKYNAAINRANSFRKEQQLHREQTLRAGRQIASAAASGRGTTGSVLDIMSDTAYQSELDVQSLRVTRGLDEQLKRTTLNNLRTSTYLSTGATLLGGVSDVMGKRDILSQPTGK